MSARTEQLLVEIADLESKIAENPNDPSAFALKKQLASKQHELIQANEALNEGRQVLKG
jgi:hypothetical protein